MCGAPTALIAIGQLRFWNDQPKPDGKVGVVVKDTPIGAGGFGFDSETVKSNSVSRPGSN